jgi:hypothetical protein
MRELPWHSMRRIASAALIFAAGCSPAPKDNVLSHSALFAAWMADGRVVYAEPVDIGHTSLSSFAPVTGKRASIKTVSGTPTFLDADDTDRLLVGGIGGAYSILKEEDGSLVFTVPVLPDTTAGYTALHLAASGTQLALATLPPTPDLQVHRADTGATTQDFAAIEGSAVIREIDWTPDDAFLFYSVGDPTGAQPDRIVKVSSTSAASKTTVFQDATIPRIDRLFLSGDGLTLLFSGKDDSGKTGVWTVAASGGAPVRIETEGGSRLTVQAGSGLSPDGMRFVLLSTTARGPIWTVEDLP